MNKTRILDLLLVLFAITWIFIIGVDYVNKHPWYPLSIEYFKYPKLALFVGTFSALISLSYNKVGFLKRILSTGPAIFFLFLTFLLAIGLGFGKYALGAEPSVAEIGNFLMINLRSLLFLLGISVSAHQYGSLFKFKILDHPIYRVAIGLIIIGLLLFGIAALRFLNPIGILIVLLLPLVLGYKSLITTAKGLTIKSWDLKGLNVFGGICLSLLTFYIALNFAYDQAPFPIGFDTRNFYMNISQQLAQNEGLIYGYRPYNWALIISMGFSLFESSPVPLSISLYGYILALFAMFHLGTRGFKVSPNKVLFAMLLFTVTPAVTNQLFIELKTDMGLFFFQLVAIALFLRYVGSKTFISFISKDPEAVFTKKSLYGPMVLLGLMVGFGLGIKMTNMFLLFSMIICLFWILNENYLLTAAVILLTMALFILVRLDDLSGVRNYHLGLDKLFLVLAGVGVLMLGFSFFKLGRKLVPTVMLVAVMGVSSILPLSPWLVKNFNETRSLNPKNLLNGATPGPGLNFDVVNRNYINSKG